MGCGADISIGFYKEVVDKFCGGSGANNNSPLLVCTDADYQFIKVGSPDPGDPQGRNIEVTRKHHQKHFQEEQNVLIFSRSTM